MHTSLRVRRMAVGAATAALLAGGGALAGTAAASAAPATAPATAAAQSLADHHRHHQCTWQQGHWQKTWIKGHWDWKWQHGDDRDHHRDQDRDGRPGHHDDQGMWQSGRGTGTDRHDGHGHWKKVWVPGHWQWVWVHGHWVCRW